MMIVWAALATQILPVLPAPASATVTRSASGWQVEYSLESRVKAAVFPVSALTMGDRSAWRAKDWRVMTPGVRIERYGAYDVLVPTTARRLPARIVITFSPTNVTLSREYDPAVRFSNGSVALYTGQFDLVPVEDPAALATAEVGLSAEDLGGRPVAVKFHDSAGAVFVEGRRQIDPILTGAQTYVIFGTEKVQSRGGVAILSDPALPSWLSSEISTFSPSVAATYAERLGARDDNRLPLLLLGWRGPTAGKVVNDGGVRSGMILFNFEGEGLLERNPSAERRTKWFIAHEMAHFWLGSSGVRYRSPGDAWITEGGADLMALTLLAKTDRDYALSELQRSIDDCVKFASKPIAAAGERNENRAYYACGTVFALAVKQSSKYRTGDFFDWLRPLLDAHRATRVISGDDWLDYATATSRDPAYLVIVRSLIDHGSPDPAGAIASIFEQTGVPFSRENRKIRIASTAF